MSSEAQQLEMIATQIREHLEDKSKFRALASFFISNAVEEAAQEQTSALSPELLKAGLEMLCAENTDIVFASSASPIETIFLNSLALCFIRNGLPLVMMSNAPDVLGYIEECKEQLVKLNDFADWYEQGDNSYSNLGAYFNQQVSQGAMPIKECKYVEKLLLLYRWLNFQQAYHLVIQAGFPQIKVGGRGIRTDLLFWMPADDGFKLVVECDGFQYHSDRNTFINDRKRDRALLAERLQVMRFSGNEINSDPAGTANGLFDYLLKRM